MKDILIDDTNIESKGPFIYKFQIIEFLFVAITFSLFMMRESIDFSAIITMAITVVIFSTLLYQLVRISFEYKNQLITKGGIALKIFLLVLSAMIFIGMWAKILDHPAANVLATSALLTMALPYTIYAAVLDKISSKTKTILAINGACISVLAIGILTAILGHPLRDKILSLGMILTALSMISFILLTKGINKKGRYHSLNYFGRSLLLMLLGLSYFF